MSKHNFSINLKNIFLFFSLYMSLLLSTKMIIGKEIIIWKIIVSVALVILELVPNQREKIMALPEAKFIYVR